MEDIIRKIQQDILDPRVDLGSILRSAKVLAHGLENQELKGWVNSELDGYQSPDEVPDYRMFTPSSYGSRLVIGWHIKNQIIPVRLIDDQWLLERVARFNVTDGLRTIQSLASREDKELKVPWDPELVLLLNNDNAFESDWNEAYFVFTPYQFEQILDTVRNRLLDFVLELGNLDWDLAKGPPPERQLQQLVQVKILNNLSGGNMSVFDQRDQNVNYQYNAAGNINIDNVQNADDLIGELAKLLDEIGKAKQVGVIDEDDAIDAEYQVQKAIQVAKKPEPDKKSFADHMSRAKMLLDGTKETAGLVTAVLKLIETAQDVF